MRRHWPWWAALLLAALWYGSRHLPQTGASSRDVALTPFFPPDRQAAKGKVAGLVLEGADGRRFEYYRRQGMWRLAEPDGLLADETKVLGLWHALADAVARSVPLTAGRAGLEPVPRWRITFHGRGMRSTPSRDPLFTVELGGSFGPSGVFARLPPEGGVVLLPQHPLRDRDPASTTPPLADLHLVPRCWPISRRAVTTLRLIQDGQRSWELRGGMEAEEPLAAEPAWVLETDEERRPVSAARVQSWLRHLRAGEGVGPTREDPEGLAALAGSVLVLRTGPEEGLELRWNHPGPGRVQCSFTGTSLQVEAELLRALAPSAEEWLQEGPWPWEPTPPGAPRNR